MLPGRESRAGPLPSTLARTKTGAVSGSQEGEGEGGLLRLVASSACHQPSSPLLSRKGGACSTLLGCRGQPFPDLSPLPPLPLPSPTPHSDSHLNLISSGCTHEEGAREEADVSRGPLNLRTLWGMGCRVVADRAWLCSRQSWVQIPARSFILFSCRFIFYKMGVKAPTSYNCCHDEVKGCSQNDWQAEGTH